MKKQTQINDVNDEQTQESTIDKLKKLNTKRVYIFNTIYVITTLLSFLYYVFYVGYNVYKNGLESPLSIVLLVFVCIYAVVLITCAIMSSSFKTAKKRIKIAKSYLSYFRKSIKVISLIMSIIVLCSTLSADNTSTLTLCISIFTIVIDVIKIWWSIVTMIASVGLKVTKGIVKSKIKKYKTTKKIAPESIDTGAIENNQND